MTDSPFSAPPADFFLRSSLFDSLSLPLISSLLLCTTATAYLIGCLQPHCKRTHRPTDPPLSQLVCGHPIAEPFGGSFIAFSICCLAITYLSYINSICLFIPLSLPCQSEWPPLSRSSRPPRLVRRPRLSSNSPSPSLILRIRSHRIAAVYLVPNSNRTDPRLRHCPRSPLRP